MYSTEDEQEPVVKRPQKASKIPKFVDAGTENEQETTVKQPEKADDDPQETSPPSVKTVKIPNFAAASCTYILTKGARKCKQCRMRASDKTCKFCIYRKEQT